MAQIVFDGVSKRYADGFQAVKDLSLQLADGEFLVLVGPSGCGKSTALRMVAGLEDITEGELRIGDRLVNDLSPRDRDIAMVFQSYALYPHLTVRQNIGFGLRVRRQEREAIDAAVSEAAALLELTPHLDRRPGQLSGGQRQRVAMGRAIVRRPAAFLMDEPLSNLDAKLRVSMRGEITRIQKLTGTTTIYVTHDQIEAMTMGDRVAVLASGVLQQVGPPRILYESPVNLFVASFIGSPAINLLRARLDDQRRAFHLADQQMALPVGPLRDRLEPYAGREVIVGIRPEHFAVAADPSAHLTLSALTGLVEHLGANLLAHLTSTSAPPMPIPIDTASADDIARSRGALLAVLDPETPIRSDETVSLSVPEHRVHVFDPETGRTIR